MDVSSTGQGGSNNTVLGANLASLGGGNGDEVWPLEERSIVGDDGDTEIERLITNLLLAEKWENFDARAIMRYKIRRMDALVTGDKEHMCVVFFTFSLE